MALLFYPFLGGDFIPYWGPRISLSTAGSPLDTGLSIRAVSMDFAVVLFLVTLFIQCLSWFRSTLQDLVS